MQVSFAQGCSQGQGGATNIVGRNGAVYPNIRCYKCNKFGHYSDQCPEEDNNANGNSVNGNTDVTGANEANAPQAGVQCEQSTSDFF